LIASKYEEIYPPELKDFVFITDNAYTKADVLQMEFLILNTLSFDVTFPTSHRFLERYTKLLRDECSSSAVHYAYFLMDLALLDVKMLQYSSSLLAASALGHACKFLK
jgi:cyclin B